MSRNHDLNRFFGARPVLFVQPLAQATSIALEDDELALDLDEPPEHTLNDQPTDCVPSLNMAAVTTAEDKEYTKQPPTPLSRQCSLLTRSLLSASTPDETSFQPSDVMARANSQASAYSLSSNHGLTSDGGLSSPAHSGTPSPPLPAAARISTVTTSTAVASHTRSIKFAGEITTPKSSNSPRDPSAVRKTRISFAGGVPKSKSNGKETETKAEQPKKACTIRFACHPNPVVTAPAPIQPQRKQIVQSRNEEKTDLSQQVSAPLPATRRHRNSQSVHGNTSDSFKARFSSSSNRASPSQAHKLEKERLKRLASNRPEDEAWVNENPKARKPITVTDTLRKENAIRQLAAEAEEEALEESMEALIDDEDDEDEEDATGSKYMAYDEDDSDGGHETDDEGGFAESDDDSDDDPDFQFWTTNVANAATATGSVQQRPLDLIRPRRERTVSESSFDSVFRSGPLLPPPRTGTKHNPDSRRGSPKAIKMRPGTPELPDSTDFVCGTLDEDKPLEDAYLSCLKQRKRERQGIIPQDLDPSFPTSDPENNEDDEEDEVTEGIASTASDHHFLGGRFDESDNSQHRGRASSPRPMAQMPMASPQNIALLAKKPQRKKSPAPPPVHRKILRSPAPPATKTNLKIRSPTSTVSQKIRAKSPAPQVLHFARAKSPLPGRLFSQSPVRLSFPPPATTLRSPPASPRNIRIHSAALAERPGHVKTASLPHTPNPFFITHERRLRAAKKKSNTDGHDRGPIDIKQGLEDRKQRRKEHYWRKHCRDHKDKSRRCAPGKGAERMRVLGLEMAHRNKAYGQKLELMLSV